MPAADRGALLLRLADLIEENADELARTRDARHRPSACATPRGLDVPRTAATFRYFGGMADKLQGSVVPVEAGLPQLRRCANRWALSARSCRGTSR